MNRQERRRKQRALEKEKSKSRNHANNQSTVKFVCLDCGIEEDIPKGIVQYCDAMDDGDVTVPPRFSCENCSGEMIPKKYKGVHDIDYKN